MTRRKKRGAGQPSAGDEFQAIAEGLPPALSLKDLDGAIAAAEAKGFGGEPIKIATAVLALLYQLVPADLVLAELNRKRRS